jgi:hypothetical protein
MTFPWKLLYHFNDDGIKTCYSGVKATDVIIWRAIDTLYIIHTRYRKSETYIPSAIIGTSPIYNGERSLDPS